MAKKRNIENADNTEKIKAPVHNRKKGGKRKQATKQKVREKLAKLQNEAIESVEKNATRGNSRCTSRSVR